MKRFSIFLFCLLSITAANASAQELKWFHSIGWYPFTMKDETTGQIYGVSNDIMNAVARKLNVTASFQDIPWKRGFIMLDRGTVDICAGAYDNAERREKYLFSVALFKNETRIFVSKDNLFKFNELADLKGKRLGKPLGASYGSAFDSYAKANITMTENPVGGEANEKLFAMLLMGRLDGMLGDHIDVMHAIRKAKLDDKIVALDKPVNSVDVFFMVSKKSPWAEKIELLNQAIKSLADSGEIAEIVRKY